MAGSAARPRFSCLTICAALLLGSAIAVPAQTQTVPLTLGAIPPEDVVPLAGGGLERALADLPEEVESVLKRSGVPGAAVAVVHDGKTIFARGFGVRELGKEAKVDTATVFQIASMSKPIAATIAAMQVTAGKVKWDDKITRHLPTFAVGDAYVTANGTVGDFYSHRSGLPHAAGDTLEDIGFDRKTILERLRMLPLAPFRVSYNYANFGFTTGAEAVAAAAGKPWADLAQEALYGPLGMTSTSSRYADFLARENRATLHTLENGRFIAGLTRDPDQQSPAGGVTSNVTDLAEWAKLILANGQHDGREMISPAALLPALRAQAFSAPAGTIGSRSGFYGFGFNVSVNANGRPDMSHSGAFVTGAATNVQFLPSADLAILVLTNAGPVGAAEAITGHFLDIVQYGAPTRDWYALMHPLLMQNYAPLGDLVGRSAPSRPAPARPLADYVGTYDSPYFGPARISQDENGLVLTLGPEAIVMPMTHWDGDVFSIAPRSENAPYGSLSSVRFEGAGGALKSMRVDYLNEEGLATWTR
ncbi:CubicO group peptidase (beta-lactamase class C family) [Angulomicrobium tetraedrale]|uniref:CubicO group peptidase (Beta-lactamase class C family) n=1 Tax=Ancylobacter tetraedralis TaxID=217068 RepID=A0A839ZGG0_9HYPH|nr:serine hydrolase [Ancylobacter tetraedralis]MBB3773864.1 CubicO group peptidase (beta-lactamase class C family) [Ancylobacter tetraedralis]